MNARFAEEPRIKSAAVVFALMQMKIVRAPVDVAMEENVAPIAVRLRLIHVKVDVMAVADLVAATRRR